MGGFGQQPLNPIVDDKPFDVDDIVKKIDAKIAELEKEEELNNQKTSENSMNEIINNENKQQENNSNLEKIINDSNETKKQINDDEFFDDFFE